ncbi:MAG: hypothetical protein JKX78_00010 [Alteromonadaceae bacterium]|nr:hypothetical protein [Alteromonadaceae bacterium]
MQLFLLLILLCTKNISAEEINPVTVIFIDGYDVGTACTLPNEIFGINECILYIAGVQDTITTLKSMGVLGREYAPYCLPKDVILKDLVSVVANHYKTKQVESQKGVMGPINIMVALIKKYPCNPQ